MAIDFDKFREWAESRFGDIVVKGREVKINSVFAEDYKHHMWCRPDGGKKKRDYGVYHCWKTGNKGTLVSLVMQVDKCTFEEACETLDAANLKIAEIEKKLDEMFFSKSEEVVQTVLPEPKIEFPPGTYLIDALPNDNAYRCAAIEHLTKRKIPSEGLYVCTDPTSEYRNRIIIPYYGRDGSLIYWNGRTLSDNPDTPKYLGPDDEIVMVGKGDVVFMADGWPADGTRVFFTEGEFDAKSISLSKLPAGGFGGKSITERQADLIRPYLPVICLDGDGAGLEALPEMGDMLLNHGFKEVWYAVPPKGYKDWNKLYELQGPKILAAYLLQSLKPYHYWTGDQLRFERI